MSVDQEVVQAQIYTPEEILVVFDGQGVFEPGMGKVAYTRYAAAREVIDNASDVVGVDLARVCFGDLDYLQNDSRIVQPAIVAVDLAEYAAWKEHNGEANVVTGLSLGMIAAMGAAKYFETYSDAVIAAAIRARIIHDILKDNPGRMAGIVGMAMDELEPILKKTGAHIAVIRDRLRKSFVVTGGESNVEATGKEAKSSGARKWEVLSIFGSFHHPILEAGVPVYEAELENFNTHNPAIRLLGNNASYLTTAREVTQHILDQIVEHSDWDAAIDRLDQEGIKKVAEFGPDRGRGLARQMNKRFGTEKVDFPSAS